MGHGTNKLDRTIGLDWTGLDWTGLTLICIFKCFAPQSFHSRKFYVQIFTLQKTTCEDKFQLFLSELKEGIDFYLPEKIVIIHQNH